MLDEGTPVIPDMIIYHAQCPDGSCAAMIAHTAAAQYHSRCTLTARGYSCADELYRRLHVPEMMPLLYTSDIKLDNCGTMIINGNQYIRLRGNRILIVDFSFPRPVLERIAEECVSLQVLDHHKTAQADLSDLPYCQFDMSRSGARMCYDYYYPGQSAPWSVNYVQDRDLWAHALPDTQAVNCYLSTLPHDDMSAWLAASMLPLEQVARDGAAMLILKAADVRRMKERSVSALLAGHLIRVAAAPVHESEVAGELCIEHNTPFAAAFYQRADGLYSYSLRSRNDFDVSAVARMYGGGGHKQAAGFTVPHLIHAPVKERR